MQATLDTHERLKLFPIAIGERDGPVTFHVHPDSHGSTTVDWQEGNFATPITVRMRSIDSLIEEGEIARPDLIKMDIQAGELATKAPSRRFQAFALCIRRRGSYRPMGARFRCS